MKAAAFPQWIPQNPQVVRRCVHLYFIGSHGVSLIIRVILWNQYVNIVTPPCIGASLTELMNYSCFSLAHGNSITVRCFGLFCEITSSFCASPSPPLEASSAYRIPFLWSKAGIMEAGCSDMRATTNCSTSWRFSSCGQISMMRDRNRNWSRWWREAEREQCLCSFLRLCKCIYLQPRHNVLALQLYHLQL